MSDQLLGDRIHFAGRHALHVHLRERCNERLLRTLLTLEQLGGEPTLPVLRNPQFDLADPRDQ